MAQLEFAGEVFEESLFGVMKHRAVITKDIVMPIDENWCCKV